MEESKSTSISMSEVSSKTIDIARRSEEIRAMFPILHREVYGKPLVYLDNAATSQKPERVIDAVKRYYAEENSNVHRGVHHLSQLATGEMEGSRKKVASFINSPSPEQVIFTKGTTEGINLVANSYGRKFLKPGDEVLITEMEHHSNIVPWQLICDERGANLRVAPITDEGEIDMEEFKSLLNEKTRLVAVSHISNTLGTVNPVEEIISLAHNNDSHVLVDGAQAVPHSRVNVQELDADFYVFSGHKMFGPTGVGILYGREELLEAMPPYQGGGEMIKEVSFEKTIFNDLPFKFEAGTPNIAGATVLGETVDFIEEIGYETIGAIEDDLLRYATARLEEIEGVQFFGTASNKASVISFNFEGVHPYDVGTLIDKMGIAVRTGHHCTQPIMDRFGIAGTIRASMAMYNTRNDIDRMMEALLRAKKMLS